VERKSPVEKRILARPQLKYERERRGWTLEHVATQIDCPESHMIARWERGIISPSPRYRQALCELFGKNAEELGILPNSGKY
jgi:transcriptional regulator with XRE-family HTH domain